MSKETKTKITAKTCPNCGGNGYHCTVCWDTGKWYTWEIE